MFRLVKQFRFEASHMLPEHDGKCSRLHGHSWVGSIICEGPILHVDGPKAGMLIDYADLSAIVKPIVEERLDHFHLNDSLGLKNPTSEAIAVWIWKAVYKAASEEMRKILYGVIIEETCTSRCEYYPRESLKHLL